MDKVRFAEWIRGVYAAFGKAAPAQGVMAAVYRRIDGLPDGFLAFAAEQLEDRDSLPANLGRELRRVLWPEYLEKNPELRAREQPRGCRECAGSPDPGIIWAWSRDGHRYALPCVCNTVPSLAHIQHWTLADVEAADLLLYDPLAPEVPERVTRRRVAVGQVEDNRARERVRHLPVQERVDYAVEEVW